MGVFHDIKTLTVAKVDEDKALLVLLLNIIFPGVGSMMAGKVWGNHQSTFIIGIIQCLLFWLGWILTLVMIGVFIIPIGWIWSIWWGYFIFDESTAHLTKQ